MEDNNAATEPSFSVTYAVAALCAALAFTLLCLLSPDRQQAAENDRRFSRHAPRCIKATFGYILSGVIVISSTGVLIIRSPYLLWFVTPEGWWWAQLTCMNGPFTWACAILVFSVDYEQHLRRKQMSFLLFLISVAALWIAPACFLLGGIAVRVCLVVGGMVAAMSILVLTASNLYLLMPLVIPGMLFGGIFVASVASLVMPLSRDMGILNCTIGFGIVGAFLAFAYAYTIGPAVLEPDEAFWTRRFNSINTAMEFYLLPVNVVRGLLGLPELTASMFEVGQSVYTTEFLRQSKLFQSLTGRSKIQLSPTFP